MNAKKIVRILAVFIFALTACGTADNDELETKNNIEETENSSNDVTSESTEQESDADEDTSTDDSENEIEETTLEIQESVENNDKQDTAELVEENKPSESPKKTRPDEKKQKANSKSKANTPAATPESKPAPKPAPKNEPKPSPKNEPKPSPKNEPKPSPAPAPKPAEPKKPESKPEIPKVEEPKQSNSSIDQAAFERKVAELTNKERLANGLAPLTFDSSLSNVARIKSNDMFKNNYFSHTSPTYGSPFDMMRQYGITYYSAAENIAMGQRTPEQVVQGWMNSPGHKANILNDRLTHIGVGLSDGNFYWTQMFIGK